MEQRTLGRTGLRVSALGFGCGDVGGLIVRGTPAERERAVRRAIDAGVNYFDTASSYGNGESEQNLGATLKAVGVRPYVGTKFRLDPADADLAGAVGRSLDASLQRLAHGQRGSAPAAQPDRARGRRAGARPRTDGPPRARRGRAGPRAALQRQGKIRFFGITALGDTAAVHQVVDAGVFDTAQVCLNLLNPSAAVAIPAGFPAQDFGRLLDHTRRQRVGTINIRVLAGGALSGTAQRHAIAMPQVAPIASGADYAADVERAHRLQPVVDKGYAADLMEASMRFSLASDAMSTVLVGYSTFEHLERAIAVVEKGPLPAPALDLLNGLWAGLAQEPRR